MGVMPPHPERRTFLQVDELFIPSQVNVVDAILSDTDDAGDGTPNLNYLAIGLAHVHFSS